MYAVAPGPEVGSALAAIPSLLSGGLLAHSPWRRSAARSPELSAAARPPWWWRFWLFAAARVLPARRRRSAPAGRSRRPGGCPLPGQQRRAVGSHVPDPRLMLPKGGSRHVLRLARGRARVRGGAARVERRVRTAHGRKPAPTAPAGALAASRLGADGAPHPEGPGAPFRPPGARSRPCPEPSPVPTPIPSPGCSGGCWRGSGSEGARVPQSSADTYQLSAHLTQRIPLCPFLSPKDDRCPCLT